MQVGTLGTVRNKTAVIFQVERRLPRQQLANQAWDFELDVLSDG